MKRALEKFRRERNDGKVALQPEPTATSSSADTRPIGLVKYWGGAPPPHAIWEPGSGFWLRTESTRYQEKI